jgi:hypothetical protein
MRMAVTTGQSPTIATDNPSATANLVWHYACAPSAALIGQEGVIRSHPDPAGTSTYGIIWFSDRNGRPRDKGSSFWVCFGEP